MWRRGVEQFPPLHGCIAYSYNCFLQFYKGKFLVRPLNKHHFLLWPWKMQTSFVNLSFIFYPSLGFAVTIPWALLAHSVKTVEAGACSRDSGEVPSLLASTAHCFSARLPSAATPCCAQHAAPLCCTTDCPPAAAPRGTTFARRPPTAAPRWPWRSSCAAARLLRVLSVLLEEQRWRSCWSAAAWLQKQEGRSSRLQAPSIIAKTEPTNRSHGLTVRSREGLKIKLRSKKEVWIFQGHRRKCYLFEDLRRNFPIL